MHQYEVMRYIVKKILQPLKYQCLIQITFKLKEAGSLDFSHSEGYINGITLKWVNDMLDAMMQKYFFFPLMSLC